MDIIKQVFQEENQISLEEWAENIIYYDNISNESVTGFFREFGARTKDLTKALLPSFAERSYKESMRHSNLVKAKMRELTNIDLANITIIVPESFKGNMLIYTEDLITSYDSVVMSTIELMNSILRDVSMGINVSSTGEIPPPSSYMRAKNLKEIRETYQKKFSTMFGYQRSRPYSKMIDHFRSPQEVVELYNRLAALERTLSRTTIDQVIKVSNVLQDELQVYISAVKSTTISRKSARAFKELTECVYEAARDVEFIGYIQANALQLYRSVKDIGEKVNKYKG